VPVYRESQVQHQLTVSGPALAYLCVFAGQMGLLREVRPDAGYAERLRVDWDAFEGFRDSDRPLPLTEANLRQRDDEGWRLAATMATLLGLATHARGA
jgi:hypothetical protein